MISCVTYLDKLIELWSDFGFDLICDTANSGVYHMQSDLYIHQCSKLTRIHLYNPKINQLTIGGDYSSRSIEVIGVYTDLSRRLR
jgi:hypothetical protein